MMKKHKRYLTIKTNNIMDSAAADYNIKVTHDSSAKGCYDWNQQIKMTYGHISDWVDAIKGTPAMTLKDDGDGITLIVHDNPKKRITFEYYQFHELYGLLQYYFKCSKLNPDDLIFEFSKPVK